MLRAPIGNWMAVIAGALGTVSCQTSGQSAEVLVEIGQTELAAHEADVDNQAWIVGESSVAPGADIRVRATWCPTPSLHVNSRDFSYQFGRPFDPVEDTGDTRDLVMRIPVDVEPGEYDLRLTCVNDGDVTNRVRETTIEIVGPAVSETPLSNVDPSLRPTRYCRPDEDCIQF
ncbi:MAG: hypothetical protein R2733_17520 [Acidimicrobiales bacterium]